MDPQGVHEGPADWGGCCVDHPSYATRNRDLVSRNVYVSKHMGCERPGCCSWGTSTGHLMEQGIRSWKLQPPHRQSLGCWGARRSTGLRARSGAGIRHPQRICQKRTHPRRRKETVTSPNIVALSPRAYSLSLIGNWGAVEWPEKSDSHH